jgi:hypothetical protein
LLKYYLGWQAMQWKSDLESLVEQTRAMVKSANLKGAELARAPEVSPLREPSVETALPRITAASPPRITATAPSRVTEASREREEIKQRVAGFRAHQEKLRREREEYYLEMTAKMRAMLQNGIPNKK